MSVCLSLSLSLSHAYVVEKCKRRWRVIRSDYTRWLNQAEQRNKGPKKSSAYYLSEDLKFLKPHLSVTESSVLDRDNYERDSAERERDSKSGSKEPINEESYKANPKEWAESVEEKSQPDKELNQADSKSKEKKSEEKSQEESEEKKSKEESVTTTSDSETPSAQSEQPAKPTPLGSSKKLEFFIKQSNLNSPNCLIIGKKQTLSETPSPDPLEAMAGGDESADETASVGGGRRLRRAAASRLKQLPIQKPLAEQRQTRLQRRKSMTIAAAHSLRSSTSPVKMTPLPRSSAVPQRTVSTAATQSNPSPTVSIAVSSSKSPAAITAGANNNNNKNNRDDIFPRPQATAPLAQQLVLARRPGVPAQPAATQASPPVRHHIATARPTVQARLTGSNASPAAARRGTPHIAARHVAPSVAQVAATSTAAAAAAAQTRTINSSGSSGGSSGVSSASGSVANNLATLHAAPISSASATSSSAKQQFCERGSQTETQDIFSDEHFLDMVRPQMREMNPRQKLHFKQKIFQALMETFDDATDFPGEGEVQHFNINTPSGFEHVSDPELRLVRELVSMVSAAKHTEKALVQGQAQGPGQAQGQGQQKSPVATQTGSAQAATVAGAQRIGAGKPTQQTQVRIQRPSAVVPASAVGDDKKLYRILQMNNNAKIRALAALRKDSIDSNGCLGNVVATRPGTFVVPASGPKTPSMLMNAASPLQTSRIQDPLLALFGAGQVAGKVASSKDPLHVRQMGRRYSVCGAGGPVTHLASPSAAVAENMQLKRRMAPASQTTVPPQQRARYSHSPVAGSQLAAIAPGNSLLVRRAAAGTQKQLSPTGGGSVPQKMPQIANMQVPGGSGAGSASASGSGSALRASNSSLNNIVAAAGGSGSSPLKRGMVIANVKGAAQAKPSPSPSSSSSSLASTGAAALKQAASSTNNVANLLADGRPTVSQGQVRPGAARQAGGASETAGIIAADDFDMSRLKREPQEYMDDDILGN